MALYNEMDGVHLALVTGDNAGAGVGLTAWRNADVKFASAECIPCDIPLGWNFDPPVHIEERSGAMSSSRVSDQYSVARKEGKWISKHAFQTCQFIWWLMQTAGTPTNEGTPASYNTHTITISAASAPLWHGIHFERESITSNELRYDMMGCLPSDLTIECGPSKKMFSAKQDITVPFAFAQTTCDNIAAQTPRPWNIVGTKWKTWNDLITGNGAGKSANLTGLLYNGASLEVDVVRSKIKLSRIYNFDAPDTNGYFTTGLYGGFDYSIELDVVPVGNALYALNLLKKESYAGDLDFDFYYNADNTNDKIRFNFDKMYMKKFREVNDYKKYFEGYTITLIPYDTTSSLTVTGIDGLDNTHFENP